MSVKSQSLNEFIAVSPPDTSLLDAPLFPGTLQDSKQEVRRLSTNIK